MKRLLAAPGLWLWPVATLAVVALHFWFPETSTGILHDSYSASAQGQKAFYRLIAQHPVNVDLQRNRRPLTALLGSLPTDEVLCILGPERPPTTEEWIAIVDWVRSGGRLLYAFQGEKAVDASWFKVKYEPSAPASDDLEPTTSLVPTA